MMLNLPSDKAYISGSHEETAKALRRMSARQKPLFSQTYCKLSSSVEPVLQQMQGKQGIPQLYCTQQQQIYLTQKINVMSGADCNVQSQ